MLCFMPVTVRIDGLRELLDQQFSVVSRGQLLVLGMEDHVMQWRIRAGGPWQVLLPGVYLGLTGAPNLPQQEVAALLYAAPGSIITGPVALVHHGPAQSGSAGDRGRPGAGRPAPPEHRFRPAAPDETPAVAVRGERSLASRPGRSRRGGHHAAAQRCAGGAGRGRGRGAAGPVHGSRANR